MPMRLANAAKTPRPMGSGHVTRLFLAINKTVYSVEPLACETSASERAFRLNKADGTLYDVAQTRHGAQCDCADFIFRREGLDPAGCKHVRALVAQGLIEGQAAALSGR